MTWRYVYPDGSYTEQDDTLKDTLEVRLQLLHFWYRGVISPFLRQRLKAEVEEVEKEKANALDPAHVQEAQPET